MHDLRVDFPIGFINGPKAKVNTCMYGCLETSEGNFFQQDSNSQYGCRKKPVLTIEHGCLETS